MKKNWLGIIFIAAVFIGVAGYYGQVYVKAHNIRVELTAVNSLSQADQDRITVSPKDSTVQREWYGGEWAHKVTFHHTETESLGELIVYIGMDRETILGEENTK
ncbi:hypothetical protein [Domibacillus enclensis]|uniref:Uncharacterized protein n=1 Tax=Domibacillus enclensis TaxID=1017273 RepID=A0A1N6Y0A8_9BACI|nr:hypothetical protein [Domibacillus enclensis]OXS77475.1 hypothetical protein B1B05_11605 [Domibacillus enclensis]SIR08072.1 hypothetical protein SAMN05443094_105110 [Domibacillus enclensis]